MEIPSDAPKFELAGAHACRVVSLHDGDTFTGIVPFENSFYKFSIRLAGIDTAEMTSKDDFLKTKAFLARDKLFNLLANTNISTLDWRKRDYDAYFANHYTLVNIECDGMDKYGRVLARVSNFSDVLISQRLAYTYDGGKKLTEDEQKRILT